MKQVFKTAEEKMQKTLANLEREYDTIRAGRASAAVLDRVTVDYYGSPTPIAQVAAVAVPEPRTLTIAPWDSSLLNPIAKAIQQSDIGINPQNDGKIIRLAFPPLTEDRRKMLIKDVAKYCEEAKVSVRAIRRDAIDKLKAMKKASEITEDDLKTSEKTTQDLTDKYCKKAEEIQAVKEKELLTI